MDTSLPLLLVWYWNPRTDANTECPLLLGLEKMPTPKVVVVGVIKDITLEYIVQDGGWM